MDREALLKMLDLKAKPQEVKTVPNGVVAAAPKEKPAATLYDYSLELDKWDKAKGEYLAPNKEEAPAWADFHAAAFKADPQLTEGCVDQRRQEFVQTLLDSPEYKALHTSTIHNEPASELAARSFAKQFSELKEQDKKREAKKRKPVSGKEAAKAEQAAEMALFRAVGKALEAAQEDVEELEQAAMGIGGHGGDELGKLDPDRVVSLYNRVKNSPKLRRIVELAGKFRRLAQGKQRQKFHHGYGDLVGVRLDDVPELLLPEEQMLLLEEETELDTLRRLAERETLAFDFVTPEKVGKGPIIVTVDESGSMSGEKVAAAKAFALAMAWVAQHQNRVCILIGFAGGTKGTRLVLKPHKWDEIKLVEWLEHFYSGGTTCDVPFRELPEAYWPEFVAQGAAKPGKTDLIFLTDGQLYVPNEVRESFKAWKMKNKVKAIGLMIGCSSYGVEKLLDEVHEITHIGTDEPAIESCLSI